MILWSVLSRGILFRVNPPQRILISNSRHQCGPMLCSRKRFQADCLQNRVTTLMGRAMISAATAWQKQEQAQVCDRRPTLAKEVMPVIGHQYYFSPWKWEQAWLGFFSKQRPIRLGLIPSEVIGTTNTQKGRTWWLGRGRCPSTTCGRKSQEQRIALWTFATAVGNVRHCMPPQALQKVSPHVQCSQTGKKLYQFRWNVYDFIFGHMGNFFLTRLVNSWVMPYFILSILLFVPLDFFWIYLLETEAAFRYYYYSG